MTKLHFCINEWLLLVGIMLAIVTGLFSWGSIIDFMICRYEPCLIIYDVGATPRFFGAFFGFIGFFISIAFWGGYEKEKCFELDHITKSLENFRKYDQEVLSKYD